jgi:hypothetical protein
MSDSEDLTRAGLGHGTNRVCGRYVDAGDHCGCATCGHTRLEHLAGALTHLRIGPQEVFASAVREFNRKMAEINRH